MNMINGTENQDLNVRSAYLHVIGDAISSVGVILAAVVITFTGWTWLDPLMSAVIGMIIFTGSFRVLKSSLHILVEGVPEGIKLKDVNATLHENGRYPRGARSTCMEHLLREYCTQRTYLVG